MKVTISKTLVLPLLLSSLSLAPLTASAQEDNAQGPPQVLLTVREFPKLGMEEAHLKSEAAQIPVLRAAKSPDHYLGLESLTGSAQRDVFFRGYSSMEDMESTHMAMMKIPGLIARINKMNEDDEAMLTGVNVAIWRLRSDLSSTNPSHMSTSRIVELVRIDVKPGHVSDVEGIVKRVIAARAKANPDYHADVFQSNFGTVGGAFLVVIPMKSMASLDTWHDSTDAYRTALGEEGARSNTEAAQNAYLSASSNLFVISPRMSYMPDSWTKADPAFWNPKPMADAAQ